MATTTIRQFVPTLLNWASLFAFLLLFGEQFYLGIRGITGDTWWNYRIANGNHLMIIIVILTLATYLLLTRVKHPLLGVRDGLVGALASLVLFLALANNIWWLGNFVYNSIYGSMPEIGLLQEFFFVCVAFSLVIYGRPFTATVRQSLLAIAPMTFYLLIWGVFGFHVSYTTTPTQYINDMWVNITEIGFWGISCLAWAKFG
jgi:hypothetical protein